MEFKVFLPCFTVFAVSAYAASVCKCGPEKKETVSKYKVKVNNGEEEYDEEIEVDTEKQTETFHIPKTDSSNAGEVDTIFDFKKNLAMYRPSASKACFLSNSTENRSKPDDLMSALNKKDGQRPTQAKNAVHYKYDVAGTVNDRSILSDEMASMCAKLPIYWIRERKATFSVDKETLPRRVKRHTTVTISDGEKSVKICMEGDQQ